MNVGLFIFDEVFLNSSIIENEHMTNKAAIIKTVFISYSWTTPEHQDWVSSLATRLMQDGVVVKFDKWDLKEGHDKYSFMESMVKSDEIERTLIVVDKEYARRANERKGGVGTETLIITPNIYDNVVQKKFIPIVTEVDEDGKAYLPTYLAGRIYIDFSNPEQFEASYERLLRNIYNRPEQSRPRLGQAPGYLFVDTPMQFKTTNLVRTLDSQIEKHPNRINFWIRDFLEEYINNLTEFVIPEDTEKTYEAITLKVLDIFSQYLHLKQDYVNFLSKLLKSGVVFDTDIVLRFFEKLYRVKEPPRTNGYTSQSHRYEHFKLITEELFLYTVAISLKSGEYSLLAELFHSRYLLQDNGRAIEPEGFYAFNDNYDLITESYRKLKDVKYYSVQAEIIMTHINESFSKDQLVEADLLCYYIASIKGGRWFPKTYIYRNEYNNSFEFFNRMVSLKHVEKVKAVFDVNDRDELISKLKELNAQGGERGYSSSFSRIPAPELFIKIEQVGVSR